MKTTIVQFPQGIIDKPFLVKTQQWAGEVVGKTEPRTSPDRISIFLWVQEKWEAVYAWLTDQGEKALNAYVRTVVETPYKNFQLSFHNPTPK